MQVVQKAADKAKKDEAAKEAVEARKEPDTNKVRLFTRTANKDTLTSCAPQAGGAERILETVC